MQRELAKKGVQFAGIALDSPGQVADFAQDLGINYPILMGLATESENMRSLGNNGGGLPYTLVYDRHGNLREKILGRLDRRQLEGLVLPLI
jgi:peroxiredoxin